MYRLAQAASLGLVLSLSPVVALSQDTDLALAKKLSNPVAALISVPFQNNFDFGGGHDNEGFKYTLNIQPVVPITLSADWNVISRTIVPITYQKDILPPAVTPDGEINKDKEQFGLGDTVQSLFLSLVESPIIWGLGPVFLVPTATDKVLGSEKFGIGPTGVALNQQGPWTYGALVNHIWSFAGDGDREDVSLTLLQPFVAFNTPNAWTFSLQTEATRNWKADKDKWTVPIGAFASKLVDIGGQKISFQGGPRYYAAGPSTAPDWGLRFAVTFLFPK